MNTYQYTFSDGQTITETTSRVCAVVWRVIGPDGRNVSGFSKNQSAAMSQIGFNACLYSVAPMDKSKTAQKAREANKAYRAACVVEIHVL